MHHVPSDGGFLSDLMHAHVKLLPRMISGTTKRNILGVIRNLPKTNYNYHSKNSDSSLYSKATSLPLLLKAHYLPPFEFSLLAMSINISIKCEPSPLVPFLSTPQQPLLQLPSLTPHPTCRPPLLFAPATELRSRYSHLDSLDCF